MTSNLIIIAIILFVISFLMNILVEYTIELENKNKKMKPIRIITYAFQFSLFVMSGLSGVIGVFMAMQ